MYTSSHYLAEQCICLCNEFNKFKTVITTVILCYVYSICNISWKTAVISRFENSI